MNKIIQKLFLFTILVVGFIVGFSFFYNGHIQVQAQQLCSFCNSQYNQCASECAAGDVGSNCIGKPNEFQCCIDGPGNPGSCQNQFDQCEATCFNPTNTPIPVAWYKPSCNLGPGVCSTVPANTQGAYPGLFNCQQAWSAACPTPTPQQRFNVNCGTPNSCVVATGGQYTEQECFAQIAAGRCSPTITPTPNGVALQSCTIVGPTNLTVGQTQNYTATLNPTNASIRTNPSGYLWAINGPNVFSNTSSNPTVSFTPTASGSFTLLLAITDTVGNTRQCNNGNLLSITVTGGDTPTPNTTIAPTATTVPPTGTPIPTATIAPTITTCPGCNSPTPIPPTATPTNTGQPTAYRIRNAVDSNSCQSALSSANATQMQAGQTIVTINSWDLLGTGDLGTPASGSLKTVCGQFQVDGVWGTPFFGQITYTGTNPTATPGGPTLTPTPTTIPNTCGSNDCNPICALNASCLQVPNVATRQCSCQLPTPTPTTIPNTCGPSDCTSCAVGASCSQVPGVATRQCSCQFLTTPTPTPTSIPNTCGVNDCSSCAVGASCTQVPNVATRQCTCQFVPTGTPTPTIVPTAAPNATLLFLSVNLEGFTGTYVPVPSRLTEPVEVKLASGSATAVDANGVLAYSSTSRHFEGQINLGNNVAGGQYKLTVKPVSYLAKDFGAVTLTNRIVNFIPFSQQNILLSCDLNNDNVVNILDIGQVLTDLKKSNIDGKKIPIDSLADITRDGFVDIFDHNFCVQNFLSQGVPL